MSFIKRVDNAKIGFESTEKLFFLPIASQPLRQGYNSYVIKSWEAIAINTIYSRSQ
jgi:hypothetical protein